MNNVPPYVRGRYAGPILPPADTEPEPARARQPLLAPVIALSIAVALLAVALLVHILRDQPAVPGRPAAPAHIPSTIPTPTVRQAN